MKKINMSFDSKNIIFKGFFFVGIFLSFLSFFFDHYQLIGYDDSQTLLFSWYYNIFIGWYTIFTENDTLNTLVKPTSFQVPLLITILTISMIGLSFCGGLLNNSKQEFKKKNQLLFSYANFFLMILIGFYIFVFPILYLFPNELFFPFLLIKSAGLNVNFFYSIGPGYILQTLALFLIFPYAFFFHSFLLKFYKKEINTNKAIESKYKDLKQSINLDSFIAEEEFELKNIKIKRND